MGPGAEDILRPVKAFEELEAKWARRNSYAAQHYEVGMEFMKKMTVNDFELLKVVGKGSFGKVYQVRHKSTNTIYALKSLKKAYLLKRKQVAHTQSERKILQKISCPFIVNLKFAFQTDNRLYLGLEYFSGGELFYHLKTGGKFGYEKTKFYAMEILLALEHLHDAGVIYRDLKPENLLLDDKGHIRLTDFGLSKDCIIGNQETKTFCGTPEYLAPEILLGKPYTKAVDWWSYGTVCYELTCGLPPFYNQNIKVMYHRILTMPLRLRSDIKKDGKEFFLRLLQKDPKKRLGSDKGASEVKSMAYFKNADWKACLEKKIKPPFVPKNETEDSTDNIEPEILNEAVSETPIEKTRLDSEAREAFPGFTYESEALKEIVEE
ncbi:hypothetical protein AAMO2058_001009700 [Amorphochlora amoebiformis]